jgi:hypothetical protein
METEMNDTSGPKERTAEAEYWMVPGSEEQPLPREVVYSRHEELLAPANRAAERAEKHLKGLVGEYRIYLLARDRARKFGATIFPPMMRSEYANAEADAAFLTGYTVEEFCQLMVGQKTNLQSILWSRNEKILGMICSVMNLPLI